MARTTTQKRTALRGRAKKRERPLGAAIGWGLAVTLGVGLVILTVQLLVPGTFLRNYYLLLLHAPSATLPLSPLTRQLSEEVAREEALFSTPLSLLCGGLTLGRLAPRYAGRRRVLAAGAIMAFGVLAVSLSFLWADNIYTTRFFNVHEGGVTAHPTAPADYLVRQSLWGLLWIAVSVLGTWLGLRLRDRRLPQDAAGPGRKDAALPV